MSEEGGERHLSAAVRLMAASGLHFMAANHQQVLSDTFYKSFEIPVLDRYDSHRQSLADRQASYELDLSTRTKLIRETEARNLRDGRRRTRDLGTFRRALRELQGQVDEVERVKAEYYREVAEGERDLWESIADKMGLVVRSEVDLYDRIASKGLSDPTLESMLSAIPDPFDAFTPQNSHSSNPQAEIYSILPPLPLGVGVGPGMSSGMGSGMGLTPAQAIARRSMVGPIEVEPHHNDGDTAETGGGLSSTPKTRNQLGMGVGVGVGPTGTIRKAPAAPPQTSPLRGSWMPSEVSSVSGDDHDQDKDGDGKTLKLDQDGDADGRTVRLGHDVDGEEAQTAPEPDRGSGLGYESDDEDLKRSNGGGFDGREV